MKITILTFALCTSVLFNTSCYAQSFGSLIIDFIGDSIEVTGEGIEELGNAVGGSTGKFIKYTIGRGLKYKVGRKVRHGNFLENEPVNNSTTSHASNKSCVKDLDVNHDYYVNYAKKVCELSECGYDLVVNRNYKVNYAKKTCELSECGYDLVVNHNYKVNYAKKTCELSECGYDLVVNHNYKVNYAKKTCELNHKSLI